MIVKFFEKKDEKYGNPAEPLISLYVNLKKHLDRAAVSSAGKCTGRREKKNWNCIWDTPALRRSAGRWKSSFFSLAAFRKSHRTLCKPHNKRHWEQKAGFALLTPLCFHSFKFATLQASWQFSSKERRPLLQTRPSVGRLTAKHDWNVICFVSIDKIVMTHHLHTWTTEFRCRGVYLIGTNKL